MTARYYTRIYASNNRGGKGVAVEVLASSREEARKKAVKLGWSNHFMDPTVIVDRVEEIVEPEEAGQ